jgi:putative sterol carrier protein
VRPGIQLLILLCPNYLFNQVGCVYRLELTADGGATQSWIIDLKNGGGSVRACANTDKADCIMAMKDADYLLLMTGKLNAQQAFMKGQVKIRGNVMLAQKLSTLTKLAPKL